MLEFIQLKKNKDTLLQMQQQSAKVFQDENRVIYQRVLGHRYDIPNSRCWKETSELTTPNEIREDWISGKYKYTLIFWSKDLATKSLRKLKVD